MVKIKILCYEENFEVYEVDQCGQEFNICNFWSYQGDSFDAFVRFLEKKEFGYEVVEMY